MCDVTAMHTGIEVGTAVVGPGVGTLVGAFVGPVGALVVGLSVGARVGKTGETVGATDGWNGNSSLWPIVGISDELAASTATLHIRLDPCTCGMFTYSANSNP